MLSGVTRSLGRSKPSGFEVCLGSPTPSLARLDESEATRF